MSTVQPANPDLPILRLQGVSKAFGALRVLDEVDLAIQRGKTTVIIGPSGVGKSVLLKLIVALLRPDRGRIDYEDRRIDSLSDAELVEVRTQFGFLFQMGALFDSMTVRENICFPLIEHTAMTAAERNERCRQVLLRVGLNGTQDKMPAALSGGQRKRIALARAIALHPRVILYDEPTTGLDPVRSDVINELLNKLRSELAVTSIVVTHDMTSAYTIADRMVMLYDGRLIADGSPQEIQQTDHPVVRRFIEGKAGQAEWLDQPIQTTGPGADL